MNVHKFNVKPKYGSHKTIKWLIPRDVKYPAEKINTSTWKIFCQENTILRPNEVKQLTLGVGFMMSNGVVLVCLANSLRKKRSIQNEVNLEDTNDIIITISNNSKEPINIQENEVLCFICYKKL